MNKLILLFVFIIGTFGSIKATELTAYYDSIYTQGNKAYQQQKFDTALQSYMEIVNAGIESSDLYFNIANSHYKLNQSTRAILYYEKAVKLSPQDKDIQYNLELANKLTVDKIETLPTPFYTGWWNSLVNSLSMDTFGNLSIAFIILSMIALLFFLRTNTVAIKRTSFYLFLVFALASSTTYLFARSQLSQNYITKHAIVFATRTNIYSAPNTTSTVLFVVHDGLKVKILKTEQKWLNIMLPDGSIGWIPEEALVVI